ncbi:cobalt ECF transporter T component CbiQ [Chamaesiphon sp.]|uniref:cobalt ECF transporter T component CbiQ n=1 Tax=Chamaesiphon sp. TaxID=2814140 RepID=UPI00359391EE
MNIHIDTLAYSNRLRQLPPAQKLWFAIAVLLLALVTHYPVQIVILGWMSVWIVVYAGIPAQVYGAMLLGVLTFLVTSLPALILDYTSVSSSVVPADALWHMDLWGGYLYLSRQGLLQAVEVVFRSMASTAALFFIVLTIPAIELATICERLGCPPILVELLLLAYRFIFLLSDTAQQIITAQIARGGYRTQRLAMNSLSLLIRQLIQRTASRYQQLTLAVKARGFEQEFRFWQPDTYQYSPRYARESIGGCVVLVVGEILYRCYV